MDVTSRRIGLTEWGRLYGLSKSAVSRLHAEGKLPPGLQIERFPTGRYYVIVPPESERKLCAVYARVSSADQKADLERQVGRLAEWCSAQGLAVDRVVSEIGSGLNGRRPKLRGLLMNPKLGTLVVEHRERLCRFGFEYLESALMARGARILVMDPAELEDDLVRDVTEVMTSFCARLHGRRSAASRAKRGLAALSEGNSG